MITNLLLYFSGDTTMIKTIIAAALFGLSLNAVAAVICRSTPLPPLAIFQASLTVRKPVRNSRSVKLPSRTGVTVMR
jgi:hypothetical protein